MQHRWAFFIGQINADSVSDVNREFEFMIMTESSELTSLTLARLVVSLCEVVYNILMFAETG